MQLIRSLLPFPSRWKTCTRPKFRSAGASDGFASPSATADYINNEIADQRARFSTEDAAALFGPQLRRPKMLQPFLVRNCGLLPLLPLPLPLPLQMRRRFPRVKPQLPLNPKLPVVSEGAWALASAQASRRDDHFIFILVLRDNVHKALAPLGVQADSAAVRAHEEEVPSAQLRVLVAVEVVAVVVI